MIQERTQFNTWVLHLGTLTFASTQILLFMLLPVLSERLSLSMSSVIGCFSLGSLMFLWGAPFWSSKSDTLGRGRVLSWGLAGLSVSFLLIAGLLTFSTGISSTVAFLILLLSRLIYGSLASAIVPVTQLAVSDLTDGNKHMSSMFSLSLSLNIGRALGPALLLGFNDRLELLLAFLICISAALTMLSRYLRTEISARGSAPKLKLKWVAGLGSALLITILFATYTGILHSSLGHTLSSAFHLNGTDASALMAKVLLLGTLVMVLAQTLGKLFLKHNPRLNLFLGLGFLFSGAVLFAFLQSQAQLWSGIVLVSVGIALIYPSHLALVHESSPKEKKAINIGLLTSGNTIGYALGGSLTSLLLSFDVNKVALFIVSLLFVVALLGCRRLNYAS